MELSRSCIRRIEHNDDDNNEHWPDSQFIVPCPFRRKTIGICKNVCVCMWCIKLIGLLDIEQHLWMCVCAWNMLILFCMMFIQSCVRDIKSRCSKKYANKNVRIKKKENGISMSIEIGFKFDFTLWWFFCCISNSISVIFWMNSIN